MIMLVGCAVEGEHATGAPEPADAGVNRGETTIREPLSNTEVTVRVENANGVALSGQVVVLVSDGVRYDVLTYDPLGDHVPSLAFGRLQAQTVQQAGWDFLSPRAAHAFAPFRITVRLEPVPSGQVVIASLQSTGHFGFQGMLAGGPQTVCAGRDDFPGQAVVQTQLELARSGVLVNADRILAWGARDLDSASLGDLLAEALFDGLDPDAPALVSLLTSADGLFKLWVHTGESCQP